MAPIGENPITLDNVGDIDDTEMDIILNSELAKKRLSSNLSDATKGDISPTNESLETSSNLPSTVAHQEKKAIKYFEDRNKLDYLNVVEQIQKLRTDGKINYIDLGNGKYSVTMPCGDKTVKMEFPQDTSLSDRNYTYTYIDWNDKDITTKETTRNKLWSEEGKRYLGLKEEEGQKILSKSEFQTLIQSLSPEGTEEEQILAFMLATGFYGRMWLKDTTSDHQYAVKCSRDERHFIDTHSLFCGIVYSTIA